MASVNKVILVGNLGKDPEVKYRDSGGAVCNISVATSEQWKDKGTGDKKEKTEWHRVVLFDRPAEVVGEYCRKGSPVYLEGKLQTRSYEKDGETKYITEVVAFSVQLLGKKGDSEPREDAGDDSAGNPTSSTPATTKTQGDFDDDIPF